MYSLCYTFLLHCHFLLRPLALGTQVKLITDILHDLFDFIFEIDLCTHKDTFVSMIPYPPCYQMINKLNPLWYCWDLGSPFIWVRHTLLVFFVSLQVLCSLLNIYYKTMFMICCVITNNSRRQGLRHYRELLGGRLLANGGQAIWLPPWHGSLRGHVH